MDSLDTLSTGDVEVNQYTLTWVEELDSLQNLSPVDLEVENDQYTLTRVEEVEVAAAILVVFLVSLVWFGLVWNPNFGLVWAGIERIHADQGERTGGCGSNTGRILGKFGLVWIGLDWFGLD